MTNQPDRGRIDTLLNYLREQIFKAIYLEIYWEKSFQIVVLFSWIILLDNAVVAEKKIAKLYILLHNPDGNPPKDRCIRAIAIMIFILSNTFKHYNTVYYCQISSWYGHWFDTKLR